MLEKGGRTAPEGEGKENGGPGGGLAYADGSWGE